MENLQIIFYIDNQIIYNKLINWLFELFLISHDELKEEIKS